MEYLKKQLDRMDRTDVVNVFLHTLKRHASGYPNGISDFEVEFANQLHKTSLSTDKLVEIINKLGKYSEYINSKTKNNNFLKLTSSQPIKKVHFGLEKEITSSIPSKHYSLDLVGIKSHRYADNPDYERGQDEERPYVVWTCFGPGFASSGVTEHGKFVVKNSEYLFTQNTNVFSENIINFPRYFVYQVVEEDNDGPSREDVTGFLGVGVTCASYFLFGDLAGDITKGVETVKAFFAMFADFLAKEDNLYPIQMLPINENVVSQHAKGNWDYHGDGGTNLFNKKSNYPFRIIDEIKKEDKLQWDVVCFLTEAKMAPVKTMSSSNVKTPILSFYSSNNYLGNKKQFLNEGDFETIEWAENDNVSSLVISKGFVVELFEHSNFKGRSITLKGNVPRLSVYNFNNKTSSFKIKLVSKGALNIPGWSMEQLQGS